MTEKIKQQWFRIGLAGRLVIVSLFALPCIVYVLAADDPVDTDHDGWSDIGDSNPVSRAWIEWGNPLYTSNNVYEYPAPEWLINVEKSGGDWITNAPTGWHVDAADTNSAFLFMDLDRSILTNDLVLKLLIYDHTNASLSLDYYDTNDVMIATNVVGNLSTGGQDEVSMLVDALLQTYTNAVTISLRRESGEVTVYTTLMYIDQDHDGLDADQEAQLGTSDHHPDTDTDGLSDYEEAFVYGTDPLAADSDNDGLSDGVEVHTYHTNPDNMDTDGDGLSDGWEVQNGFNPAGSVPSVGYWAFDETEGAVAWDSSGFDNNGVIYGAVRVPGVIGNALRFDGASSVVEVTNSPAYKPSALTVGCYAMFDSLFGNTVSGAAEDGRMTMAAQANAGGGYGYALYKSARNSIVFEVANSAASNAVVLETCDAFVETGTWYNVIGTYDGTNACLYIDGRLFATQAYSLPPEYSSSSGLAIGNNPEGMDSSYCKGVLDSVRVTASAMAAAEIAEPFDDADGDSLSNLEELWAGTNPRSSDSDNDGLSDWAEIHTYHTNPSNVDTDGDGMPDNWEIAHALNPLVNDAAGDLDQDGLTNLQDYQHGADPRNADTDGDGMPDGWEVAYGLDPLSASDATQDPDNDGLNNLGEYKAGTDLQSADTDDDGVVDGDEVFLSTDPCVAQFDGTTNTIAVIDGSQTNAVNGTWEAEGAEIVCNSLAGWVEYIVQLPTNDVYKLTVEATHIMRAVQCSPIDPVGQSDLMLYADGQYLGRRTLTAPDGLYGTVDIFTPYLAPGSHTIRVRWDNAHERVSLKIKTLTVRQLGGPDSNSNGAKDWVEESLANLNNLDDLHVANSSSNVYNQSWVSPVSMEGPGGSVERMAVTADGVSNTVYHGVGDRWYADAPLSPTGGTEIVISFENGALALTTNITWTALNLLDEGNQRIRKQDALMLTACPEGATNGTVTIAIAGVTNYATSVDQPVIHTFTTAGTYKVTGIWEGTNTFSNTVTVTVMAASFPTNTPAFMLGTQRTWSLPNVPSDAVLEADATVTLGRLETGVNITLNNVSKDHYMTARVSTNGAILASSKLNGFWVQAAVDNRMWVVEDYGDSQLWENVLVAKNLPPGVDIQIDIFKAGVTFEDMTTERWITAADLNAIGEYRFRMIHPDSVTGSACHTIRMYQNGVYLGEAYYSGTLMPEE